jgi:putative NADH-flavin reductase
MHLVVFGANGPTGRLVTKQALASGHSVTAFTRHPAAFPLRHERLQVMGGDVFDLALVEQAVVGQEAVLSTLGVPYSRKPITVYSQGMTHIMQAMQRSGVRRLVCVSSNALDPQARSQDTGGGFLFEKILKPLILNGLGRTTYADVERMETVVRNSQLDWTILRPSGLFETEAITPYQVAEGSIPGRFTSRADLADCMLQQLATDQYLRKVVAVATVAVQPGMLKLLVREAFQVRLHTLKTPPVSGPVERNARGLL